MKYRYLVFSHAAYYPGGGMSDCVHKTNDKQEAIDAMKKAIKEDGKYHGGHEIYNCEIGEVIEVQ